MSDKPNKKESIWNKDIKELFKKKKKKEDEIKDKENINKEEDDKKNKKKKKVKEKLRLAVDIGEDSIHVLVGTKHKIVAYDELFLSEGVIENGDVSDIEEVKNELATYLKSLRRKPKDVCFVVHGDDIITRYIELPILGEEALETAIKMEIKKSYPDKESLYYYSYQLVEEVGDDVAIKGKYMIVMAKKVKIDKFIDISEKLKLNIKCIDLSSNSLKRVLSILNKEENLNHVGAINIQDTETTFCIMNNDMLQIEKRVHFGTANIRKALELSEDELDIKLKNISVSNQEDYFSEQVLALINTLTTVLNNVAKFYFGGRSENNLNKIYIVGKLNEIRGIEKYFAEYFESEVIKVEELNSIVETKTPDDLDLIEYINCYGLLIRELE